MYGIPLTDLHYLRSAVSMCRAMDLPQSANDLEIVCVRLQNGHRITTENAAAAHCALVRLTMLNSHRHLNVAQHLIEIAKA